MVLIALFVGIKEPNFFTWDNFKNLSVNTTTRFIIALGVSGCLITKGTDLSAGRMVGFGACIAATLLQKMGSSGKFYPDIPNLPIILVVILTLVICGVFGFTNGAIISFLKVPPFIATLGMQTLIYGICLVYTGAIPIGNLRDDYTIIAKGSFLKIPYLFIIAVICGIIFWFLYNKTRHGKYMYAIGGNESAAEVAGVNTSKVKIRIYTLAAVLYGLSGVLLAAKAGGTSVNMGAGYELEAIAACTIGGVSTNGGVGKISGILIGVLVFELLKISLQFLGVETSYTYIVQGLVIIIAVALDLRKYLAKK
jgi:methyl-galactoside transport system permease protein